MKKTAMLMMAILAIAAAAIAAEPVDAAKNKELAEKLMNTLKISESMNRSFDMIKKMQLDMMAKRLKGKQLQDTEKFNQAMMALLNRELSWEKLKDHIINIYAESFTAEELEEMIKYINISAKSFTSEKLEGMTKFDESPIGKKLLEKQPEIANKAMQMMQSIMMKLMPEMEKIVKDFEAQNKADAAKAVPAVAAPVAPATPEAQPAPVAAK